MNKNTIKKISNINPDTKWIICLFSLAAMLFLTMTVFFYPGFTSPDSLVQLKQSIGIDPLTDWHPVSMALFWRLLIKLTGFAGSLLYVQLFWIWSGLLLIAVFMYSATRSRRLSVIVLAAGLLPFVFNISGVLWKDVQMASALLLAIGLFLISKYVTTHKDFSRALYLIAIILVMYATSVRANAFIATTPIFYLIISFWADGPVWKKAFISFAMVCLSILALLVLGSIFHVEKSSMVMSIKSNDVVNIVNPNQIQNSMLSTSLKNDLIKLSRCSRFSIEGKIILAFWNCGEFPNIYSKSAELDGYWRSSVLHNFPSYFMYKMVTFSIFLFDTDYIYDKTGNMDTANIAGPRNSIILAELGGRYVENFGYKNFPWFYRGWFWLVMSVLCLLYASRMRYYGSVMRLIALSGTAYELSFLVTSTTPDFRYIYWTIISCLICMALLLADRHKLLNLGKK